MRRSTTDKLKADFRNFLFVVWQHLDLRPNLLSPPTPTPLQYDIAHRLQHGPRRDIIEAFRGVGKSWITVAFCLWLLYRDPQKKIEVVSAGKGQADNFTTFCLQLINSMDLLAHLRPRAEEGQRSSKAQFDVGPALESKDPSVKSVGITGQITGTRADVIIADDVETPNNTLTVTARERLREAVKEFDAVLKPGGMIKYLGTPQHEESLYHELSTRGYGCCIWPARYPEPALAEAYGEKLAPIIISGEPGRSTEPQRFSDVDLAERELSYGRSGFALQFMLDPAPSTRFKHPLRLSDLVVMDINPELAPEKVVWAAEPTRAWDGSIPCVGLQNDRFYRPLEVVGKWLPYTGAVMYIDPSGRGKDETGYAVSKMLNSFIWVPDVGGLAGGYETPTLKTLAGIAKEHGVNRIVIEDNFGDGMYARLFAPVLRDIYPCTVEEIHSTGQKERRIIDTLEPVMNRHRLIVGAETLRRDYQTAQQYPPEERRSYMLQYQLTRITSQRGSLPHDDRLEALAGSVAYWTQQMSQDENEQIEARKAEELERELARFVQAQVSTFSEPVRGPNWLPMNNRR